MSTKPKLNPKIQVLSVNDKGARIRLQNVRLAFVRLSSPAVFEGKDGNATYQVTALIPEGKFAPIEKAVFQAVDQATKLNKKLKEKEKAQALKTAKSTGEAGAIFKVGDNATDSNDEPYEGMAGMMTLRAKTGAEETATGYKPKVPIQIVDHRNRPIPREELDELIYSGVWADLSITLSPYPTTGVVPAGVTCYLNGVMRLIDDERLGGGGNQFEARDDLEEFGEGNEEEEVPVEEEEAPLKPKGRKKF
jgi:hypothetical protein